MAKIIEDVRERDGGQRVQLYFQDRPTGSSLSRSPPPSPFTTDATTQFEDGFTSVGSLLNQVVTVEGSPNPMQPVRQRKLKVWRSHRAKLRIDHRHQRNTLTSPPMRNRNGFDDTKVGASFTLYRRANAASSA